MLAVQRPPLTMAFASVLLLLLWCAVASPLPLTMACAFVLSLRCAAAWLVQPPMAYASAAPSRFGPSAHSPAAAALAALWPQLAHQRPAALPALLLVAELELRQSRRCQQEECHGPVCCRSCEHAPRTPQAPQRLAGTSTPCYTRQGRLLARAYTVSICAANFCMKDRCAQDDKIRLGVFFINKQIRIQSD